MLQVVVVDLPLVGQSLPLLMHMRWQHEGVRLR
jgi:hypothetical protein